MGKDNQKKYNFSIGGRPPMGEGLEGEEYEKFIYQNKISKRIEFKLTGEEFDLLQEKFLLVKNLANIDRSTFIKQALFGDGNIELIEKQNKRKLIIGLNKIGVNINQVVKNLNSHKLLDSKTSYQLKALELFIKDVRNVLNNLNGD